MKDWNYIKMFLISFLVHISVETKFVIGIVVPTLGHHHSAEVYDDQML